MKCNDKDIAPMSIGKSEIEGRLNYRKIISINHANPPVFKERWFKLINNFLFYFKINDLGKIEGKHAYGVFLLEGSKVTLENEQGTPFTFSISFIDEPDKKHIFAARSQENVQQWVSKLRRASYEYLRSKLYALQENIFSHTGKDPLLMVPRNEGSMKWVPGTPLQKIESCSSRTHKSSFHCHLEKQIHNTLNIQSANINGNYFSAEDQLGSNDETIEGKSIFFNRHNPFDKETSGCLSVTEMVPQRAAPSPPVRKRHSPTNRPIDNLLFDSAELSDQKFSAGVPPVKPVRKHNAAHATSNDVCNTKGLFSAALLNSQLIGETDSRQEPLIGNLIEF